MKTNQKDAILEAMFADATLGILVANVSGEIILCNKLAEDLFGYTRNELLGQKVEMLLPDQMRSRHVKHRAAYLEHPTPRLMGAGRDLYGRRKDGSIFPIEISLSHVRIEDKTAVIAFISNIRWRKEQEEKLRHEKELAQMYLEMAGSIILVLDKEENITLINREGALILGGSEEEIIGQNWFENFVPEKNRAEVRAVYYQLLEHQGSQLEYYENKVRATHGEIRLISWHNRLLQNEKGEAIGTISSGTDITLTREAELMLQESKARLKNYAIELEEEVAARTAEVFESQTKLKLSNQVAQIGYWEISLEEQKELSLTWSEEFFRLFDQRYTEEPLPKEFFLQFIHPEDREVVTAQTRQAIKTGEDKRLEFRITTSHGQPKYISSELRGIRNQYGKLTKIFGVIQDITENKEIEKRLEQNLKKEKELGELKSRFVSMASHEFRTPLSAIQSSVDLIKIYQERGQPEKLGRHIGRIKSSVQNLTNILNDFLNLEKLESGKIIYQPEALQFEQYMRDILEEIGLLKKEDQEIHYEHRGADTAVLDKHLLRNILNNLLSNAIKYSGEGARIEVRSEIGNQELSLSVKDQGIGIPQADQEHLMTRFFRATNVTNIQGTGLGLTIVRRYLDMMGGSIWFESKEGAGTTFFVKIPQE
ncbi:sensor histidine kinase [Flavilitoribacter nigricans]|uniref:sensor histidine kinase n=1 Tax=Flavilitoribacter nigricans TaxID=70997 RepID=UPI00117B3966|nr:PAS domain S-box protein [Flavilitoribacter nigricans]